jgi:hypothetical protein
MNIPFHLNRIENTQEVEKEKSGTTLKFLIPKAVCVWGVVVKWFGSPTDRELWNSVRVRGVNKNRVKRKNSRFFLFA